MAASARQAARCADAPPVAFEARRAFRGSRRGGPGQAERPIGGGPHRPGLVGGWIAVMTGATPVVNVPCEAVAGAATRTAQAANAQPRNGTARHPDKRDGRAAMVFSSTAGKPPRD
ncbi:hypothetical protein GO291_05127 [Ralstonia solanacearum]|nr:hypothetical protein GO278_005005 [Ralstonia solanacearum]NKA81046.1 hypothetical protein [Ralstonia solanacearum]